MPGEVKAIVKSDVKAVAQIGAGRLPRFFFRVARGCVRFWFYLAILCVFALGWFVPAIGREMNRVGLLPYLVAIAFFLNGFTLSTQSLIGSFRQWRILLVTALLVFIVAPLIMFALCALLPNGHSPLGQGFQLVALVPTMLVSAMVLTRTARGNGALALFLTVMANLLAIILIPPLIAFTLGASGVKLPIADTSLNLMITVLLPTVLGQVARRCWPVWAVRHERKVSILSQCTILLFILIGFAALPREHFSVQLWVLVIAGVLGFRLLLLSLGWLGGKIIRIDAASCKALTFCSSEKSMVFVILLWERLYASRGPLYGLAVLPGILYYLIELVTDSTLAQWWRQHDKIAIPAPEEVAFEELELEIS
jgi:predicted Na+-dependent transporter